MALTKVQMEWSEDYPDHSGHLPSWKGETALPTILDCLYHCPGRFREELISEDNLGENFPRYFHLEVHLFYSYSDVVAMMGRRLSTFSVEKLQVGKRLHFQDRWVKMPLRLLDLHTYQDWVVKFRIVDWYSIEYTNLLDTCRTYNLKMEDKRLMDQWKSCMDRAYIQNRDHFIQYALSDLKMDQLSQKYHESYLELCKLLKVKDPLPPPRTKGAKVVRLFSLL